VTLDPVTPKLTYKFNCSTEEGVDRVFVLIDPEFPDSCGWAGPGCDTLRCYSGVTGTTMEDIDLSDLCADPDLCDPFVKCDYSGDTVKICFVVVTDGGWDDEDGRNDTCDGALTVDEIFIDVDSSSGEVVSTGFEDGTLQGWQVCGGWSPGDYAAIRDRDSFTNNDPDLWQGSGISGCVLTFFNPDIAGQYGGGAHYAGAFHKRAWSPPMYVGAYPERGYMLAFEAYVDLPISNYIFYRRYVRYVQNPDCPAGAWSSPLSDGFVYYSASPSCTTRVWDFSDVVPADCDSIMVGLSVWTGCIEWSQPCTEGNESPVFDNVAVGVIANIKPEVTVLEANGGEIWYIDEVEEIVWEATDGNGVDSVSIYYSTNGGGDYTLIASGETNDGMYPWTVPKVPTEQALIKILAYDPSLNVGEDVSDAMFSFAVNTPPAVSVIAPNGGETWVVGDTLEITWRATDAQGVDSVSIYYSTNGGDDYRPIASGEINDGTYPLIVPATTTDSALVKVAAYDPSLLVGEDVSDSLFTIRTPPDLTPLRLTVSVHQNPELTSELDIYLVPSEATQDTSVWLAVNGVEMELAPSDFEKDIYCCDYRLSGPGTVTINARARDLDGHLADTTRAFGAGLIERERGGVSFGPHGRLALSCPPRTVREDTYVLVFSDDTGNSAEGEPAEVDFVLSPPGLLLDRPARLTVELDTGEGWPRLWRNGPSGWEALECSFSEATGTLSALVKSLGDYRVTWEPSDTEKRVGLLLRTAPNPFRTIVDVNYHLPVAGRIRLDVYDVAGRRVKTLVDGDRGPGWHSESWDGRDERDKALPSGVYFLIMEDGREKVGKKCMLIR
jgi:hypothetical protein